MSLKPIKYNRALDHALLAMALAQQGKIKAATRQIQAAVKQKDAIEAMRILELNARAATNTLHAEDEEILEVEDVGEVDLDAEELDELYIESEDHEHEHEHVHEHDEDFDEDFDEDEIKAAIKALRAAKARRSRSRR